MKVTKSVPPPAPPPTYTLSELSEEEFKFIYAAVVNVRRDRITHETSCHVDIQAVLDNQSLLSQIQSDMLRGGIDKFRSMR